MWTELATGAGLAAMLAVSCALSLWLVRTCISQLIRAVVATRTSVPLPRVRRPVEVPVMAATMKRRPAA